MCVVNFRLLVKLKTDAWSKTASAWLVLRWGCQTACVQNSYLNRCISLAIEMKDHTYRSIVGVGGVHKRFNHGPSLPQLVSQCEKDSLNMVGHRVILGTCLKKRHASIICPSLGCASGHYLVALGQKLFLLRPWSQQP